MKKQTIKINFSIATNAGIKQKNEDAAWIGFNASNQILAIVCDGIGSQQNSDQASTFIVNYFQKAFSKTHQIHFVDAWFKRTLHFAYASLNALHYNEDIGTTLIVCIIVNSEAHIYNIGDSRAYYYDDKYNSWNKITIDHNLYNFLEKHHAPESTFIKNKGSLLSLTNYISSQSNKHMQYDTYLQPLKSGNVLLLSSDGFYNFINMDNVLYYIAHDRNKGFDVVADDLIKVAIKNGSNDNISAILMEVI